MKSIKPFRIIVKNTLQMLLFSCIIVALPLPTTWKVLAFITAWLITVPYIDNDINNFDKGWFIWKIEE